MSTTAQKTPAERATDILVRELKSLEESIKGHREHYDPLVLAIKLFGDDPEVWFDIQSYTASVLLIVGDINTTLKSIHHKMRAAGWIPIESFNKKTLTWFWREDWSGTGLPQICFHLSLSDNSTCRKVQVGVTETPVYEIRCDGGEIEEPTDGEET